MHFTTNICFGKNGLRCYGLNMSIKILLFFHAMVNRRNNSNGIHRLRIDNKVIEDHILTFIKIFMLSLFLMFRIQVIWKILLVLIVEPSGVQCFEESKSFEG